MQHDHAVVLGAGMAGLFAARVLSEKFDRVTVIDRDPLAREKQVKVKVTAPYQPVLPGEIAPGTGLHAVDFTGLTITPAFAGSVQDTNGTVGFDVTADQPASWTPADSITVAVTHVEVSNGTAPGTVTCPAALAAGDVWVDVQGSLTDTAADSRSTAPITSAAVTPASSPPQGNPSRNRRAWLTYPRTVPVARSRSASR